MRQITDTTEQKLIGLKVVDGKNYTFTGRTAYGEW